MKKKPYFAQDNQKHPNHRARYFFEKKEAIEWLKTRGGGTVKGRKAWKVIENVE